MVSKGWIYCRHCILTFFSKFRLFFLDDPNTRPYSDLSHAAGQNSPVVPYYSSGRTTECPSLSLLLFSSVSDTITINHKDSRWVGAWWLGFIVNGTVILLSCVPFWFLPKSLPKQGQEESPSKSTELTPVEEQESFLPEENHEKEKQPTFQELAKGTFQHPASPPQKML